MRSLKKKVPYADKPEELKVKYRARSYLNTYLYRGKIKKEPCAVCGNADVHAHHKDYSKPLDVVWLCVKHHFQHHFNYEADIMNITLPNNCYIDGFKVIPSDWEKNPAAIKKDWIMHYTFYDPSYPHGYRRQVRGMNHEKNIKNRRIVTRQIMNAELNVLMEGFNPFKKSFVPVGDFEVGPYTPFIDALWTAVKKVRASDHYLGNLKSVVRGVEKSAKQLGIHKMPLKDVTMKYFNRIFDQCYTNNNKFTGSTQNRYKKSLSRVYKELFKMEAVEFNPLALIEKAREVKRMKTLPTMDDRKAINSLKETNYYFWRAIQIFFSSGAREAELFRVKESDVNLNLQEFSATIYKGASIRQDVIRPISDSSLYLWKEILSECKPGDYLFSKWLKPGPVPINSKQFNRRWRVHVKSQKVGKLGLNVNLNDLRHLFATETSEKLDRKYNYQPHEDMAAPMGHTSTKMLATVYDMNTQKRKNDKIKREAGTL